MPTARDAAGEAAVVPLPFPVRVHLQLRNWGWSLAPASQRFLDFAVLAVLTALPYLFLTRTWAYAAEAVRRTVDPSFAPWLSLPATPTIPGRLVAFHALALVAFWLPARVRWPAVAAGALGIGFALRIVEPLPVGVFAAVCLGMYGLFRTPLPRWSKLVAVVLVPLGMRWLGHEMGWPTIDRSGTSLGLMVLLWYACYEITTDRPFPLARYAGYVQTRLFMEGPILAPEDARATRSAALDLVRWGGVKALAVALLARSVAFHVEGFLGKDWTGASGPALLGYAYLNYIAISCGVVFSYNLALGLLRLLGLPVRDNFQGWFWARTPNEHWRRWNVLFREWIITFTFYPLMRARKGLFTAIMLTLAASGVLHLYGMAFGGPMTLEQGVLVMSYWLVNGIAIWIVVSFPRWFPGLTARLGLGESRAWGVVGWLATNVFYAVMFFVHHDCNTLAEAGTFVARLLGSAS